MKCAATAVAKNEKVRHFGANVAHNCITHDIPLILEFSMKITMIMPVYIVSQFQQTRLNSGNVFFGCTTGDAGFETQAMPASRDDWTALCSSCRANKRVNVATLTKLEGGRQCNALDYDLYPWDAGTDSGITYMSPNLEIQPRERMYRITTMYTEDPRAPFYNSKSRDVIRNLAECHVTGYSEFSLCSVHCGKGIRMGTRHYLQPEKAEAPMRTRQLSHEKPTRYNIRIGAYLTVFYFIPLGYTRVHWWLHRHFAQREADLTRNSTIEFILT
uniref:Spondin domain-containing protein n=1 Tax=Glossina palpalis gambiensis TaxID=67801 RepID=A0A1B0BA15_9MUSC